MVDTKNPFPPCLHCGNVHWPPCCPPRPEPQPSAGKNADRLCKEDVDLGFIERNCCECDERVATVYISLDLGFMTTSIGDGEYCNECGKEELSRIRALLPNRVPSVVGGEDKAELGNEEKDTSCS